MSSTTINQESVSLESEVPEPTLDPALTPEPLRPTKEDEPANNTLDDVSEADLWELEAGFDEVIERPPPGMGWVFEVAETEGLNLSEPALLDMLSDQPIPGVIARGAKYPRVSPTDSSPSVPNMPLNAKRFKF